MDGRTPPVLCGLDELTGGLDPNRLDPNHLDPSPLDPRCLNVLVARLLHQRQVLVPPRHRA